MMVDCINYLSSGSGRHRVFLLAVKLAEILKQKSEADSKVQVSTLATNTRRPNESKMDSCLVTVWIGEMKTR